MMNDDLPIVAFPQTVGNEHCFGMMLRDYFAAKAMQAFCSSDQSFLAASQNCKELGVTVERLLAASSYRMADAMLEARK